MTCGEKFKVVRQAARLSVRGAAKLIGTSPTTIVRIERDKSINKATMLAASEFVGVCFCCGQFLGGGDG